MSCTLLTSTPRATSPARLAAMSATTRWMPLTEPGAMSVIGPIPGAEDDGELDPWRAEPHDAHLVGDLSVVQIPEASLLVERLRPVDIGHRDRHEFQPHIRNRGHDLPLIRPP